MPGFYEAVLKLYITNALTVALILYRIYFLFLVQETYLAYLEKILFFNLIYHIFYRS